MKSKSSRSDRRTAPATPWVLLWAAIALDPPRLGAAANPAGLLPAQVAINEIHCNPTNSKSNPTEFVELYNPLPTPVDVSGWKFTRGIAYTFAPGTILKAGGYLVVAENPALVAKFFGATALGPWVGSLANEGETLALADSSGAPIDTVTFGSGFPWPTVGEDPERSLQLINAGLDRQLGGSWRSAPPTPGARNSVASENAPPQIRQVSHAPKQPESGQIVTITAKITDPDGIGNVTLDYQIVEPGGFITLTNAAFATHWTTLAMRDDGTNGDAVAGDSIFSAQLPPDVHRHRRLIRYRLNATDSTGLSIRVPYSDDPSPDFAYFVYDGVPEWTGAVRPGITAAQTFGTNITRKVRSYHLLSRAQDVSDCQYNPIYNDGLFHFEGALVVDGKVYDHIHYRLRGQNAFFLYVTGKNKWKVKFNRGHWFEMPDDYGVSKTTVETLNWTGLSSQSGVWNRGLAGLDEALQYRLSNLAGVPAPRTSYFQLRVIDQAAEAEAANQYEGDLWGLYLAFENPDNRFKAEHGLPDGNLFRMQGYPSPNRTNNNHLQGQGAGQPEDLSDLKAFVSATTGYNKSPTQPESWWRTNINLLEYFSWRAVAEAVNNSDYRDQENVAYFRDPIDGRWQIMPWDCDSLYFIGDMWGPNGAIRTDRYEQIRKCLTVPALQVEFQNRARALQDLLLNNDQAWRLIDELVSLITENGPAQPGFVEVDRRQWDWNPKTGHDNSVPPEQRGNFYRTPMEQDWSGALRILLSADFVGQVTFVKNFIASFGYGGTRLSKLANDATIPLTPVLAYIGDSGFASDALVLQTTAFSSPANRLFTAMQWRLGEVSDPSVPNYIQGTPWRYEAEEIWNSGDLTTFNDQITLPSSVLREGRTYRARVKYQDSGGRWSHWSDPLQFTATRSAAARLTESLIVSELMYNPPAPGTISGDEFEFIELKNIGSNSLNLGGLSLTAGITFTFTNGTILPPGATYLLGRNPAQLAVKYPDVRVQGIYSGKLDNGGETLTLSHATGGPVLSFTFGDAAPWPVTPDGLGFSLVPVNPSTAFDHNNPHNWRASGAVGGSPGASEPPKTLPTIVFNEIHYHAEPGGDEFIELKNVSGSAVPLFDTANPTHTWRLNGLGYSFPVNFILGAGKRLLLVATDPEVFRARHRIADTVEILGPYSGRLQNSGERLELQQPGTTDTDAVTFITVDEVRYNNRAPWPFAADGGGASLQRVDFTAYGNDPANWVAATPTPGGEFTRGQSPDILEQPLSRAVALGQTIVFAVNATGAPPLGYQWAFNGEAISGAVSPSFVVPNANYSSAGNYSVIVFNSSGSIVSAISHLTVASPALILSQPATQLIRPGLTAVIRVAAAGTGSLHYQWHKDGAELKGQTNSTLSIPNAQLPDNGAYTAVVTDNLGSVTTVPAQLILLIDPVITHPPLSQSVVPGATVTLSVSVTNTATLPIGYRWRRGRQSLAGATFLLNERTSFLTITNAQPPFDTYSVTVTNLAKPSGLTSTLALLTFVLDTDVDHLPDGWELAFFGSSTGADPEADSDGDGMLNWQEYVAGTDPTHAQSYLKFEQIIESAGAYLSFEAISNKTYSIQYTDALGLGRWSKLVDVVAQPNNRLETAFDPGHVATRFYRLITPQQPSGSGGQ